jgi:uncharacterized protein (TIGR02246 family)
MKPLLRIVLPLAIVGLAVGCATSERIAMQGHREDEEAIKRVIMDMTDAFNRHEPDASLFTNDADFVNVNGTWLRGAADIEQGRKARFETVLKEARIKLLAIRIRFIRPDVAIAHVTNETSGMVIPGGQTLPVQRELNIRVFTKDNGRWLVTAFHNTSVRQ